MCEHEIPASLGNAKTCEACDQALRSFNATIDTFHANPNNSQTRQAIVNTALTIEFYCLLAD